MQQVIIRVSQLQHDKCRCDTKTDGIAKTIQLRAEFAMTARKLEMSVEALKDFRQLNSPTPGHPEFGHTAGVETTTGPLGQGIATAVGMAMAERHMAARFGEDLVSHYTYVLASDGDLMEGISHEAISLAGHLKLSKLIVLFDDNGISIDGPLELSETGDQVARFKAAGWDARRVEGHDPEAIRKAIKKARMSDKPSLIACRTTIGYGAPTKAGKAAAHGSPLGEEEIAGAREALGWDAEPFEIPTDVRDAWRIAGLRSGQAHRAWKDRLEAATPEVRGAFEKALSGEIPTGFGEAVTLLKAKFTADKPSVATRKASETVLTALVPTLPTMVGGSADLTGSNNTKTPDTRPITPDDFSGRFIHYGVREHGMAAAMNGMALHGGILPYSGTFLAFADYCRPAIRLAALMNQRVIHVMTHDSIGLGEDGPTHQPVEHLASLRAMPNLYVFRPCDGVETAECWQLAVEAKETPSVLALTRQNLATLRTENKSENLCAKGAYVLRESAKQAMVTLFATGSEVEIAVEAAAALEREGVGARVVSVPCFELFEEQTESYQSSVIGSAPVRIAIEAAIRMGWDRFIGTDGAFIGMTGFGASAPYKELYEHFGITAEAAVAAARAKLAAISTD